MAPPVERVKACDLTYNSFFRNYLLKNKPVIVTGATSEWNSSRDWVCSISGGPNFSFLKHTFGDVHVPVVECRMPGDDSDYGQESSPTTFDEFLTKLEGPISSSESGLLDKKMYLKDWHFAREFKDRYKAYSPPVIFQDDWLNWYYDRRGDDDYRFVYIGPKGSWTPLHHDVIRSFSWSANVCGRKLWYLFPQSEEPKFKDRFQRTVLSDARPEQGGGEGEWEGDGGESSSSSRVGAAQREVGTRPPVDRTQFPKYHDVERVTIVQEAGEALFVPSGWYHQVHNLEDTISINHNWFNATSLEEVWGYIQTSLADVEKEIQHCREGTIQSGNGQLSASSS